MRLSTSEIAAAVEGVVHGPDVEVDGATQDSRALQPGELFVPLVAERDGHDFIDGAVHAGASAYLTHENPVRNINATAVQVADTTAALGALGAVARTRIDGHVVGITGSVGKTSTKDLLAGATAGSFAVHRSIKSFNNEIGVPLTLLNAPNATELAIVEMGARGIGHIELLCSMAAPTVGVVTTVVGAHTGEFGSVENIAVAKGELVEGLPASGLAVLNGDNPLVAAMAQRTDAPVMTFGQASGNDVVVESIELDDELRATFAIATEWGPVIARPPTRGAHMATNTAAAVGVALWLGASIDAVEAGIAATEVSPWRMDVQRASTGALVINDSYNANPTSMYGALDSLGRLGHQRKIAVLGYMAELGENERGDHESVFERARSVGAEVLAVGTDLYGVEPVSIEQVRSMIGSLDSDSAILVKGSRSAGLEVLAEALLGDS